MNIYDSIRMEDIIKPLGYEVSDEFEGADLVILNTCHIREKAAQKVYSELGRINKAKNKKRKAGSDMMIAVAGCVGQAEGEEIFKRAPYVDMVVGPQSYQTLPDLISKVTRDNKKHLINLDFSNDKFDKLPEESISQGVSACVSVQEGCDKFCTFCVVPYTRGAEYSRPVADIYRETIKLVANGAKEITLLGQNVNAFHGVAADGEVWNLGRLIKHIAKIDGLERIRYSTSHPLDMHEELYEAHGSEAKLMPFLNLPIQSGADNVLKSMNRKHTRDEYFKIIERLKSLRPDMQFSTDLIVGFPGETDKDFEDTLDLVKRVNYSQCYSFKYSPRPGTPGADMENQVPEHIKDERLKILQAQITAQQTDYNKSCEGKIMEVLFDRDGKKDGQIMGRSPYMQSVYVPGGQSLQGEIAKVRIVSGRPSSLVGERL